MTGPRESLEVPVADPLESVVVEPFGLRLARRAGLTDVGRALRDFTAYLPAQAIPALAGFLALPILARQMAPTELGVLAIAQTLVSLGWIVSAQWLTSALMREYAAHKQAGDLEGFSDTLAFGLGIVALMLALYAGALGIAAVLSQAVRNNVLMIIAATAGLVLQNLAVTLFAASLRPRWSASVDILARTGGIVLGTVLVFRGYKVEGYLVGLAIASNAVGVFALVGAWPRIRRAVRPRRGDLGVWVRFGVPITVSSGFFWALLLADRYLLAILRDTKYVGIYAVGASVGDKAVSIPMFAFYAAARPVLIASFERHGRDEVERLMRAYTRLVLLLGIPAFTYAAVVAHPIVALLVHGDYSASYAPAAGAVPFVALGALIDSTGRIGSMGLGIGRKTWPLIIAAMFALTVNVVANLILIPPLGIKGSAIATPIASVAFLVCAQLFARRVLTWRFPYPTLARAVAAAAAGYGAAMLGEHLVHGNLLKLLVAAWAGGAVYVTALVLTGERRAAFTLRPQ